LSPIPVPEEKQLPNYHYFLFNLSTSLYFFIIYFGYLKQINLLAKQGEGA